jgi:hypothetical protein
MDAPFTKESIRITIFESYAKGAQGLMGFLFVLLKKLGFD